MIVLDYCQPLDFEPRLPPATIEISLAPFGLYFVSVAVRDPQAYAVAELFARRQQCRSRDRRCEADARWLQEVGVVQRQVVWQ